jgi:ribonuclease BN (tRNA processing enzyme)
MDPPLTIYGPPGTKAMVDGLVAAMEPLTVTSPALPGAPMRDPAAGVTVVEIGDGSSVTIEGIAVQAIANTHYMSTPITPGSTSAQSLSLRFELPGRSVVVTGDTGPSQRLAQLAQGADVLLSSVLDLDAAVAAIRASRPGAPPAFYDTARAHFAQHHLSPAAAGQLAQTAGVGQLLLTHIGITPDRMEAATRELTAQWSGPYQFARDLGRY